MRVGSVGYATKQGLGILLKDFYDNNIITDVLTVEHWRHPNFLWYGRTSPRTSLTNFDTTLLRTFVNDMDVMFFFETPFDLSILAYCRQVGVKTILMPMYECTPPNLSQQIDLILNPSPLDQQHYPEGVPVSVPIPSAISWEERVTAEVFVHNAGNLGIEGRNGTKELLEAIPKVKSPAKFIIRSQASLQDIVSTNLMRGLLKDERVTIIRDTIPYEELYKEGDVFVFPEKFNGLSLPLQEAKASGMLVMAADRFPINTWNDKEHLIPIVCETKRINKLGNEILESTISPQEIATTIDNWFGRDIRAYSRQGKIYKCANSWTELKPEYMNLIFSCVRGAN